MVSLRKHEEKANDYTWKLTGRGEDLLMGEIEKMIEKTTAGYSFPKAVKKYWALFPVRLRNRKGINLIFMVLFLVYS